MRFHQCSSCVSRHNKEQRSSNHGPPNVLTAESSPPAVHHATTNRATIPALPGRNKSPGASTNVTLQKKKRKTNPHPHTTHNTLAHTPAYPHTRAHTHAHTRHTHTPTPFPFLKISFLLQHFKSSESSKSKLSKTLAEFLVVSF